MKNYYRTGSLASSVKDAYEAIQKKIRDEAAKGAAPAARKQAAEGARGAVMPIMIGVGALSALSLIIALRK